MSAVAIVLFNLKRRFHSHSQHATVPSSPVASLEAPRRMISDDISTGDRTHGISSAAKIAPGDRARAPDPIQDASTVPAQALYHPCARRPPLSGANANSCWCPAHTPSCRVRPLHRWALHYNTRQGRLRLPALWSAQYTGHGLPMCIVHDVASTPTPIVPLPMPTQ